MNGYSGGRIKRIRIQNFMTYDDVEIHPKKGLNLVVGLNGSGKSSIMCAICLGLAGKPHFTGRASQLSDFIKHGGQEAEIEIELESNDRKSVIIHRKLKTEKCEWTLNNSPSNQTEVASAVKKLNIDTSNLCQFLPQEKVSEFSKMDKKQRLENMLQAIGEPYLFHLFNELKDLHKQVTEVEQSVKKAENNKNAAVVENERISDEVQKQETRVRLRDELEEMLKQRRIVIYQDKYNEVQRLNEERVALKEKLDTLHRERNDATKLEDSIFSLYQSHNKKYEHDAALKKTTQTQINSKYNALIMHKDQVESAKIEYKNKLKEKEDQRSRMNDLNEQIQGLERLMSEKVNKLKTYEEDEKLKTQDLVKVQHEISELYKGKEKANAEMNKLKYSVDQEKNYLNSLKDELSKKMTNLKRICKYTYEGAQWLLQNRNRFKANVYLPMMLEINMKSNDSSKYVESLIAFRDMIAFVCEDKGDCERLTDILKKQQNLLVNIVMAPDTSMSCFSSPTLSRDHRKRGLECFVIDLFTAPEPIMKYLCMCYKIHRIPVAKSVIPASQIEILLQSYQVFYSENTRIMGKRSRYGDCNLSIKKDFVQSQNILLNTNDENQRKVENNCLKLEAEYKQKIQKFGECEAKLAEREKIQEKLRQEKKILEDQRFEIERIKKSYIQKKQYQSQISVVIDEEEEKDKISKKILNINGLRERVLTELTVLMKEFSQLEKDIIKSIVCMNLSARDLKLTRAANEDIHEKVKAAEADLENIIRDIRVKKKDAREDLEAIRKMGVKDDVLMERIEAALEACRRGEELKSITAFHMPLDEIEQKINHLQAQLNLNEDNEPLVAEYNKRKKEIEEIQKKISSFQGNVDELRQTIKVKKKEWLDPLQYHIRNINRKFSYYFKQLNCVGEISLDIPENSDEFTKYGLKINLKFHDEETSLSELSQNRHSGGECSVAAIVFILSLQELTEVPFRCIDEINQGMDSTNERKIYQLISDSVADDKCSQYFLLTPKLLTNLHYPQEVAIHIIFNSPFLRTKLDIKEHLQIAYE